MSIAASQPMTLGLAKQSTATPGQAPPEPFELTFRREVARLIHDILHQCYVSKRAEASKVAYRQGVAVEVIVAEEIAHRVMDRVDAEYL